MRSILVTFLVAQFYNPTGDKALTTVAEAHANASTHFFVTLAYALPFVGGLVADWFTGKYKIILYISIVYCLGHLFLAMFDTNLSGFTAGLILVAIGAGGIKSCVSANVGDQFNSTNTGPAIKSIRLVLFQYQCRLYGFNHINTMDLSKLWREMGIRYPGYFEWGLQLLFSSPAENCM